MNGSNEWWQTFFSGMAVESWLAVPLGEQTAQEAGFIREALGAQPPARILDVPCGGGRHSLALAELGYTMTGVDISSDFLAVARSQSAGKGVEITWEQREMRDLPWRAEFDGAYSLGNSFGYLDDEGNVEFLKSVAAALKPGARFVLESSYIAEVLFPILQERGWHPIGNIHMLSQRRYDAVESRLHVDYLFIRDGVTEKRSMSARIYGCREVMGLLENAGFTEVQGCGSLKREPFRLGSPRLLLIATKA